MHDPKNDVDNTQNSHNATEHYGGSGAEHLSTATDIRETDEADVQNHEAEHDDALENISTITTYQRHQSKTNASAVIKKVIVGLLIIVILGAIGYGVLNSTQHITPKVITLQGQMQMQQTSIAAKVPGRIAQILVTEGDMVTIGQQLIEMDSPEINAN